MEQAKTYERRIGLLLRLGVMVSSGFMGLGLLVAAFQPSLPDSEFHPTLKELLGSIAEGQSAEPTALLLMLAGLLLLMLTPFLRVLATLLTFLAEKDWRFVSVAAIVFCILVGQLIYTLQ